MGRRNVLPPLKGMDKIQKTTLEELSGRAYTGQQLSTLSSTDKQTQPEMPHGNEENSEILRHIFDNTTQAIVIVDQTCSIKTMNAAARYAVSAHTLMCISSSGKLQLTDQKMQITLREQVLRATSGLIEFSPSLLFESSTKKTPLTRITPLKTTPYQPLTNLAVVCIANFTDTLYDHQLASSLYKLSRAELAVCEELVSGNSVKQISASRGTSTETVRYQLKSIFAKTQTNSQHGLVSLLLRATALPNFR